MIRHLLLSSLILVSGCGKKSDSAVNTAGTGFQDAASKYAGLAYAVVPSDYSTSTLLYNDFATGTSKTVSSGESGDIWIKWLNNSLFYFNRVATGLNFRSVDPRASKLAPTSQIATPAATTHDPVDAVLLDANRMLLAHYTAGKIIVMNPTTGALIQTVDASWDLGTGSTAQLRPYAFYVRNTPGVTGSKDIYVLHQGYDSAFKANDTEQVFLLRDDGTTVSAIDQDASKDGVQGIALPVSFPDAFFAGDDADSVLIHGTCTANDSSTCKQGFAKLTFSTAKVDLVLDTATLNLVGNGPTVKGSGNDYYTLNVKADTKAATIAKIDLGTKAAADVYTFTNGNGCCALYFDDTSGTLYSGDTDPSTKQNYLLMFKAGATTPEKIETSALPYAGVFVPKS